MRTKSKSRNGEIQRIKNALKPSFANVRAYRYNPASVRIRVIDSAFAGKSRSEREDMVVPLIEKLPNDLKADITVLLLLAPGEEGQSMMNMEFEHPTRSIL